MRRARGGRRCIRGGILYKCQLNTNQTGNIGKLGFGGTYTYIDCGDGETPSSRAPQNISSEVETRQDFPSFAGLGRQLRLISILECILYLPNLLCDGAFGDLNSQFIGSASTPALRLLAPMAAHIWGGGRRAAFRHVNALSCFRSLSVSFLHRSVWLIRVEIATNHGDR